jgi:hypothetical protein
MSGITTYVDGVLNLGIAKAESLQLGSASEGLFNLQKIEEEVTIAVGDGLAPAVETVGNLAPANSYILGGTFKVTQAPGGGAATLDIGVTGGGNLNGMISVASCNLLGEYGRFYIDGDGNDAVPYPNTTAKTLTLTTDADVTTSDMKILVTVWYYTVTPPA